MIKKINKIISSLLPTPNIIGPQHDSIKQSFYKSKPKT